MHGRGDDPDVRINQAIVDALKRAHKSLAALSASPLSDLADLQNAEAPPTQYERRVGRLALLSPIPQRRILAGRHLPGLPCARCFKPNCRSPGPTKRRGWRISSNSISTSPSRWLPDYVFGQIKFPASADLIPCSCDLCERLFKGIVGVLRYVTSVRSRNYAPEKN